MKVADSCIRQRQIATDIDQAAYTRYEELRRQKIRIGTQDLRIAAIVLSVGGILVTRNQRDFAHVPGLPCQDWTIPWLPLTRLKRCGELNGLRSPSWRPFVFVP